MTSSSRSLVLQLLAAACAGAASTQSYSQDSPPSVRTVPPVVPVKPAPATTSLTGIPPYTYSSSAVPSPTGSSTPPTSTSLSLPACADVQYGFPEGAGSNAERAAAVVEAYKHLWSAYEKYAWGSDDLLPLSLGGTNDWYGWGVTIVDGLDTSIVMNLTDIVDRQLGFIQTIDFTTTNYGSVEVFDVNIRYLGGMLSAYDLLKSGQFYSGYGDDKIDALLKQAVTLSDKMAYAFDTPTGIPASNVDFSSGEPVFSTVTIGEAVYNSTNTAQIGTFVLEWFRLSDLTGNQTYRYLAERAENWLINPSPAPVYPGLLGTQFDCETGEMLTYDGGWTGGVDSFLEYLIKTYQYEKSDTTVQYKDFWLSAVQSSKEHLAVHPYGWPNLTFLSMLDTNGSVAWSQDDLTHFAGGNMMLGGALLDMPEIVALGVEVTDGGHVTYNRSTTGLGALWWAWMNEDNEAYSPQDTNDAAAHANNDHRGFFLEQGYEGWEFRPELIESIFYAHRITGEPRWAEYQWEMFLAMNATARTAEAFAAVVNVDEPYGGTMGDIVDSFMYAEVLKYQFLTFSDPSLVDLKYWVFNTECHPLRVQCAGLD